MEPTIKRLDKEVIDKIRISLRLSVYVTAIDDEVTARIAKASVAFCVFFSVFNIFLTHQAWHK